MTQKLPHSPRTTKRVAAAVSAGVLAVSVAACSGSDSSTNAAADDTITIVASTAIWSDVAQAVADTAQGVNIEVTPIIEGNDVDPHHFEPTAADVARANDADIVVVGGGGYDAWLYESLSDQDKIVHALPLIAHSHDHDHGDDHGDDHAHDEHDHAHDDHAHDDHDHAHDDHAHDDHAGHDHGDVETIDGNEHIWYHTGAIDEVASDIADHINEVNPDAAATADEVTKRTDSIHHRIHDLPKLNYAQTESIADYILDHAPMTDVTPESYRKAILSHSEPAAADLAAFLDEIETGQIDALIYNPQTRTDMTDRIVDAAKAKDIQVVEIGETPPAGTNFLDYYEQVMDSLENLQA